MKQPGAPVLGGLGISEGMTDKIDEIFERHLPWVDEEKRLAFCDGVSRYWHKFRDYHDGNLHYEQDTNYQNELVTIIELGLEECWIYSPLFRKAMALMIGELFKTKIVLVSLASPESIDQPTIYIDEKEFRWALFLDYHKNDEEEYGGKIRIGMRFPRNCSSNLCELTHTLNQNSTIQPQQPNRLLVADVKAWHA